ncbi:MAG: GNAT family N-acetyltransferase, partial [Acidisphaera sp.]|nr:GNAT family N-acetyltransferase [Acidisphaera sp.]
MKRTSDAAWAPTRPSRIASSIDLWPDDPRPLNPAWVVRTGRLLLRPVGWEDLSELQAIKGDPRVFAVMLGGVRTPVRAAEELAEDIQAWGARGVGMWTVREDGRFHGIVGLMDRPDGRGLSLRFALWPESQGRG